MREGGHRRAGRTVPQGETERILVVSVKVGDREGVDGPLVGTEEQACGLQVGGIGAGSVGSAQTDLLKISQGQQDGPFPWTTESFGRLKVISRTVSPAGNSSPLSGEGERPANPPVDPLTPTV